MKSWRWGHWVFRHDLRTEQKSFREFRKDGGDDDALVLSYRQYGEITDDTPNDNVLESTSTGYGGETDVIVDKDAMPIIEAAPEMYSALRAIQARLHGVYDHPELVKFGELSTDRLGDCFKIAQAAICKAEAR